MLTHLRAACFYLPNVYLTAVDVGLPKLALVVKNLPANAGDLGSIPGLERSPGEENGNHSSIPAWRIPWTEELVDYSPWGCKESDMT